MFPRRNIDSMEYFFMSLQTLSMTKLFIAHRTLVISSMDTRNMGLLGYPRYELLFALFTVIGLIKCMRLLHMSLETSNILEDFFAYITGLN